ncbi:MAG: NADH-quinone oxidoreductase subunit NuoH [Chloroflexota bacterium]|jgi:NADH-quinone oxidoreductase subunit H|nr:NADH-quinone oxidoreductase subunit NuoH [Chloroflexota bacterium]
MNTLLEIILKAAVITLVALTGFAYLTLLERKFISRLQARYGPNRVGPFGLLQPAAEALKLIVKESIMPDKADRPMFFLAPIMAVVPALAIFAVVPFGKGPVLQLASNVNVGMLYVAAVIGTAVYGVAIAGWASNNKYASLGGLRAAAQVVSYELALGLSMVTVVLLASSASLAEIVQAQQPGNILGWNIFKLPVGFVAASIFAMTSLAELARAPYDLVEAEQELTAGYITEYSGMKFALFFMSEYIKMIALSALFATFFLGGWSGPFVNSLASPFGEILSLVYFIIKVLACLLLMVLVRATLPRLRYDKLMAFGWKMLLPVSLLNVVVTALMIVLGIF